MTSTLEVLPTGDRFRGLTVLVLGASGFIGRWVSRGLCARGAVVHLVVRDGATAAPIFGDYAVSGRPVAADLSSPGEVERIIEAVRPAVVFNLAGYGVDRSERDEDRLRAINTTLVIRLCDALARLPEDGWRGQRLVQAGSALEYGLASGRLHEGVAAEATTSYGRSKLAATEYVASTAKSRGLRAVTARLFTVYGPGEHAGRLLPALLAAAADGRPVDLSAGEQRRDFTYVEDVAEGLLRLAVGSAQPGEIVNLATGTLTAVRAFAETAASVLGLPGAKLRFGAVPLRDDEMFHEPVAIDRLRAITGWTPATDIAHGVARTRDFLLAHRASRV